MIGDVASDYDHVVRRMVGHVQAHCIECRRGVIGKAALGHLAIFEEVRVGKLSDTDRRWAHGSRHSMSLTRTLGARRKQRVRNWNNCGLPVQSVRAASGTTRSCGPEK